MDLYLGGLIIGGIFVSEIGGLIFGGAYYQNFTVFAIIYVKLFPPCT